MIESIEDIFLNILNFAVNAPSVFILIFSFIFPLFVLIFGGIMTLYIEIKYNKIKKKMEIYQIDVNRQERKR